MAKKIKTEKADTDAANTNENIYAEIAALEAQMPADRFGENDAIALALKARKEELRKMLV